MKRLIAVVSNGTADRSQQADQHRALVLLDAVGIRPDTLNGDDPAQDERRDKFFEVSGIHGVYPQFFLVDDETQESKYVGQYQEIQSLADKRELTKEALGLPPEDSEPQQTPFTGAPVEKFQSEPKPVALEGWDTNEEGKNEAPVDQNEAPGDQQQASAFQEAAPAERARAESISDEESGFIPMSSAASVDTEEFVVTDDEEDFIEEEISENEEEVVEHEEGSFQDDEDGQEEEGQEDGSEDQGFFKHEDNFADESEPFVATKEDLFGEDPFENNEDLFANNSDEHSRDPPTDQAVMDSVSRDVESDKNFMASASRDVESDIDLSQDHDVESQRKQEQQQAIRRRKERTAKTVKQDWTFHIFVVFLLVLFIGGGVAVALVFMLDDEDVQTTAPALGEQETTFLDPLQTGNCDFGGLAQPHVIDQCACNGQISIISEDIRARYAIHRADFVDAIYDSYTESINSCSSRNQALVWLSSGNDYEFFDKERRQRFALAALFIGLNGEQWNESKAWLSALRSCSWFGADCNALQNVQTLSLAENNISGGITREISLLEDLSVLSFNKNKITERIPRDLFFLRKLTEFDLSFNQITGSIPVMIEEATALEKFHVEMNSISGSIPNLSQATGLSSLKLGNNKFQGSIPSWLFDIPNLTDLLINNNQMIGTIPTGISKLSLLTTLNLSGNTLVDIIPPEVGDLVKLDVLDLSENLLNGSIPVELGNLSLLTELRLNENFLTGSLPAALGNLNSLKILTVNGNRIGGSAPDNVCQLRDDSLTEFVVDCPMRSGLEFTGVQCAIPDCCTECKDS